VLDQQVQSTAATACNLDLKDILLRVWCKIPQAVRGLVEYSPHGSALFWQDAEDQQQIRWP